METTPSDAEPLPADEESKARLEADIRSAGIVLSRAAADDGDRTDLDDVIGALGFDRSQLEAELDAEVAAESLSAAYFDHLVTTIDEPDDAPRLTEAAMRSRIAKGKQARENE